MSTQNVLQSAPALNTDPSARPSRWTTKVGWGLSILPCLPVLGAGLQKLPGTLPEEMVQGMKHLGVDPGLARTIGIIELAVVVFCLVPRTAFIGAILFTGWAGGAIMTHFRVGEPVYIQAALAILTWVGLGLRRPAEFASLLGVKRAA